MEVDERSVCALVLGGFITMLYVATLKVLGPIDGAIFIGMTSMLTVLTVIIKGMYMKMMMLAYVGIIYMYALVLGIITPTNFDDVIIALVPIFTAIVGIEIKWRYFSPSSLLKEEDNATSRGNPKL
jgi:hypothetical protein